MVISVVIVNTVVTPSATRAGVASLLSQKETWNNIHLRGSIKILKGSNPSEKIQEEINKGWIRVERTHEMTTISTDGR